MEELQPVQEPVESPAPEVEPAAAEPAAEIPAAEPLPPPDWEHRMALERADRQLDDQLRQIGRLAPEGAALGQQVSLRRALKQAGLHRPAQGLHGVGRYLVGVPVTGEIRRSDHGDLRPVGVPPQHRR